MIGVRHLGAALAQFDASTDDTAFASRQHAADIIVTRMKKDKINLAGLILADHPPGPPGPRGWLVMFDHQYFKGGDAAIGDIIKAWTGPSVNQADRQVTQDINDMGADALLKCGSQFWADAGQYRRSCKQAKNSSGASWMHLPACLLSNGLIQCQHYNKAGGKTKSCK